MRHQLTQWFGCMTCINDNDWWAIISSLSDWVVSFQVGLISQVVLNMLELLRRTAKYHSSLFKRVDNTQADILLTHIRSRILGVFSVNVGTASKIGRFAKIGRYQLSCTHLGTYINPFLINHRTFKYFFDKAWFFPFYLKTLDSHVAIIRGQI